MKAVLLLLTDLSSSVLGATKPSAIVIMADDIGVDPAYFLTRVGLIDLAQFVAAAKYGGHIVRSSYGAGMTTDDLSSV